MGIVTYRPPDVLRWLGQTARKDRKVAVDRALAVPQVVAERGLIPGIKDAANAAYGIGKQALDDFSTLRAEETEYLLYEQGFEFGRLGVRSKVDYGQVKSVRRRPGDRFVLVYAGGNVTIAPVAHLVSGTVKVAVGWLRNGLEVPYGTLVEELCARTGKEVSSE